MSLRGQRAVFFRNLGRPEPLSPRRYKHTWRPNFYIRSILVSEDVDIIQPQSRSPRSAMANHLAIPYIFAAPFEHAPISWEHSGGECCEFPT